MDQSLTTQSLQQLLTDLDASKLPSQESYIQILSEAKKIINEEPNVLSLSGNVSIIGNLCGQLLDLNEALKHTGLPSEKNHVVFLGDLVNRTKQGVEILLKVVLLKLLNPKSVTILRGKFENETISAMYGFQEEVSTKFGSIDIAKASYDLFNVLPIAALVNEKVFCVHGGLSPLVSTIGEIAQIDRKMATPYEGAMTDLIWSDPVEEQADDYLKNIRGAGQMFGRKPVETFLEKNNLDLIVRSHQLKNEGYGFNFDEKVLTIFSASDYCNHCDNRGAVVKFDSKNNRTIITYLAGAVKPKAEQTKPEEKNQ